MLVLGIDPGTAITGYGLVRETPQNNLEMVDYGTIQTAAGLPPEQRLFDLYTKLSHYILLHRPDAASVEKLFFQRNVRTAFAVGQARGVILMTMAQVNIPVFEYTPLEVKQAVSGYGSADKNQVQQMVRTLLNLGEIPRPDDAADALAIAICHLNSYRMRQVQ
jgi:crossover junction endodeoxyribonuclease RuvC